MTPKNFINKTKKTSHLLFLSDSSHVADLRINHPEWFHSKQIVTGNMIVAFQLEQLGFNFIDEWDFIQQKDIKENLDIAFMLTEKYSDRHFRNKDYGGVCSESMGLDLIDALIACLNARSIYNKIFNTYSVSNVSGYFMPPVGTIRTQPTVITASQSVLFYIAEQRGFEVEKLTPSFPLSVERRSWFSSIAKKDSDE
jgi:hypothetical protein